jgi:hypothetical protein
MAIFAKATLAAIKVIPKTKQAKCRTVPQKPHCLII